MKAIKGLFASKPDLDLVIRPLEGEKFIVSVHSKQTVKALRQIIKERVGAAEDAQKLIFNGRELEDDVLLSVIPKLETITLVITQPDPSPTSAPCVDASVPSAPPIDEEECCSICLEPFVPDFPAVVLGCKHKFHSPCVEEWSRRCNSCPLCRATIVFPGAPVSCPDTPAPEKSKTNEEIGRMLQETRRYLSETETWRTLKAAAVRAKQGYKVMATVGKILWSIGSGVVGTIAAAESKASGTTSRPRSHPPVAPPTAAAIPIHCCECHRNYSALPGPTTCPNCRHAARMLVKCPRCITVLAPGRADTYVCPCGMNLKS